MSIGQHVERSETRQEAFTAVADEVDGEFLIVAALLDLGDDAFTELGVEDAFAAFVGSLGGRCGG